MCQWWENCSQLPITPLCTSYSQQSAQANILKSRCTSVHEQQTSKVYIISGTSCTVVQCSRYAVQTCTGISFCLFLVQVSVSSVVPSFCDFYLLAKLSILLNIHVDFSLQLKILMGGNFFLKWFLLFNFFAYYSRKIFKSTWINKLCTVACLRYSMS